MRGCGGSLCAPPLLRFLCEILVPVEAPTLTRGCKKQVKCLIQAMFGKKRLVVVTEVLPTRPWEQGSHGERAPTSLGRLSQVMMVVLLTFALVCLI